jgi:hypothetical protein
MAKGPVQKNGQLLAGQSANPCQEGWRWEQKAQQMRWLGELKLRC